MISANEHTSPSDTSTAKSAHDLTAVSATDATSVASLEKVRDILFGSQMRDVERRFARLEERLVKETRELKEDVRKRIEALESYTTKETESLAGQIKNEHADRVESHATLARELADTARAIERRTSTLDDQLASSQREMRQQLLEQHQRLSDDIREKVEDILETLARETHELRSDKTDRRALASLLTEMAMRLTNEFRIPDAEDVGNG